MATFYTLTVAGLVEGFATQTSPTNACPVVELGEAGRARKLVRVAVFAAVMRDPGTMSPSGRVFCGSLVGGSSPRIEPGEPGGAIAVRVRTDYTYTRGCPGRLTIAGGWSPVAEGTTAWGDAGRVGSHPDTIIATREEGAARVVFAGGRHKGAGTRWLCAMRNPSGNLDLYTFDASPERRTESLHPAHVLRDPALRARALALCEAVPGASEGQLAELREALSEGGARW